MIPPTMIPDPPCIKDPHNLTADFPFPNFGIFASDLQIGILRNCHLLAHYIGVAAHTFPVYTSPTTAKLFTELTDLIRDHFPTIRVEKLVCGVYGLVTVTHPGVHPTISVSHDLVCAFETTHPNLEDFHKLRVIVATTLLHELSHAIQTFFGVPSHPFVWHKQERKRERVAYFKAEKYEGKYSQFHGIYLRNPDDELKIHVPDNKTCMDWIDKLLEGSDPAWDLNYIPLQEDKHARFFRAKTFLQAACQMVNDDTAYPPSSPPSQSPTSTSRSPSTSPSPSPPPAPPKVPFSISNDQMLTLLTAFIDSDKRLNRDILSPSPWLGPVFNKDYFDKMLVEFNFPTRPTEARDPNWCRPPLWWPPSQPSIADKPDITRRASNPRWCGRHEIAPTDMEGV